MMKRLSRFLLLLAAAALLTTGCGRSSRIKVGFVTNNPFTFWNYAEAGCKDAAKEFDVEVLFRRPPVGTAAAQKEIIDALLAQNVKAIAISVIDPKNQTKYLNRIAAQVPLITQDNDAPESDRLCYIGTDNYEAGKAVGDLVKKAMPEGGTIALFVGQAEPLNAQQRRQGVLDALAGTKDASGEMFGKYKLYGSGPGNGPFTDNADAKTAKENADNVLTKFSTEKNLCLIGLWEYNPPAIYAAVKAKSLEGKVKIVGFDENEQTLIGVEKGDIYGTVVQQPYKFGYEAVKLMAHVAKGDRSGVPKNGILYVPHRIITQDNVAQFRQDLKTMLSK